MAKFGCMGPEPCPNNVFHLSFQRIRDPYCLSGFSLSGGVCARQKYAPTCDPERHPQIGNPVASGNGDKLQKESDFAGYGNFPLELSRFYNSHSIVLPASSRLFGVNWTTVHDPSLALVSETQVWVSRANGSALYFNLLNGRWMPGVEQTEQLLELQDSSGLRTGWQLTGKEDTVERYDTTGHLLSRASRSGLTHSYDYSDGSLAYRLLDEQGLPTEAALPAGYLVQVRDTSGRFIAFSYNTRLLVARVTDPAAALYRYSYDTNGNLSSATWPDGSLRNYHYFALTPPDSTLPATDLLSGITDENAARYATYAYDTEGRVISSEHANGTNSYTFTYNPSSFVTTVTDPLGASSTYQYTQVQNVWTLSNVYSCPGCLKTFTHDANGNIASKTDFNGTIQARKADFCCSDSW